MPGSDPRDHATSTALDELRQLIGDRAFASYTQRGYFEFQVAGWGPFALADPKRLTSPSSSPMLARCDKGRWQQLCVRPSSDRGRRWYRLFRPLLEGQSLDLHDHTIILYHYATRQTARLLDRANALGSAEEDLPFHFR